MSVSLEKNSKTISCLGKKIRLFRPDLIRSPNSAHLMAASLWRAVMGTGAPAANADSYGGVEFWRSPERAGWLTKQGEYIKTWQRRWFVLKQGKLFWFKDSVITCASVTRGIIPVASRLIVKGVEDVLNWSYAFELSIP
jgi:hypothetical protein